MKKKLPEVKKSLKTFILEEDAKVIDKSAIKIATVTSAVALGVLTSTSDANAGLFDAHEDHNDHGNKLNIDRDLGLELHRGVNPTDTDVVDIPPKSVTTAHANHYNHTNDSSYSFFGLFEDLDKPVDQAGNRQYEMPEEVIRELDTENKNNPGS